MRPYWMLTFSSCSYGWEKCLDKPTGLKFCRCMDFFEAIHCHKSQESRVPAKNDE